MEKEFIASAPLSSKPSLRRFEDIRELIASPDNPTPIVRLKRVHAASRFHLYLKLEWFNPFGSIKDRAAWFMFRGMEERGELQGKSVVEATSGNTGIALAALAALAQKNFVVMVPEAIPEEKKVLLRMLGAEVWEASDDLCPTNHPRDGAIALARSFVQAPARQDQCSMPDQYNNLDNVKSHYETTGPEIWSQTEGKVNYFFAGIGTCGTLTGVGKFLKEQNPHIQVIAIEPQPGHRLPGLKNLSESRPPSILDRSVIDRVVRVNDEEAYGMTKRLFREEGLIVGPSTGAIVHAAVKVGREEQGLAVAISPDSGFKYASFFAERLGGEGQPSL
jgi:cysteine synthase A/cysteine synthase B